MCYLAHEHQIPASDSVTDPSARPSRLHPRWAAAAAAAVAGVAFAAFAVAPSAKSPPQERASAGAAAPVVSTAAMPGAERNSTLPPDDGVPTSSDAVATPMHDCHHGSV